MLSSLSVERLPMADLSVFSDTDNESAVDEILAEAMDHCVLKQVAAINLSGVSDAVLPTDLENRFRRLKTIPASRTRQTPPSSSSLKPKSNSMEPNTNSHSVKEESSANLAYRVSNSEDRLDDISSRVDEFPDVKTGSRRNRRIRYLSSPSSSSDSSSENPKISRSKAKRRERKDSEGKLRSRSNSFRSISTDSSRSPPRRTGCLWCSPKKTSRERSKGNGIAKLGFDWGKDDDIVADFGPFSSKEQKKILKKAMKLEEKISREAEKIVKLAKQASARMDISDIESVLSDNDSKPNFGHH